MPTRYVKPRRATTRRAPRERLPPIVKRLATEPLDVDTFTYLFEVFVTAATGRMPMHVPTAPVVEDRAFVTRLTDDPINRGMVAVARELRSMGLCQLTRLAYSWRITETSQLYSHVDALTDLLDLTGDGTVLMLSSALIKALAIVAYDVNDYSANVNLDDLIAHAHRFRAEEVLAACRDRQDVERPTCETTNSDLLKTQSARRRISRKCRTPTVRTAQPEESSSATVTD